MSEQETVSRATHFVCTQCGETSLKDNGAAVRVTFTTMAKMVTVLKSRTTGRLCENCLANDPVWNQESAKGKWGKPLEVDDGSES